MVYENRPQANGRKACEEARGIGRLLVSPLDCAKESNCPQKVTLWNRSGARPRNSKFGISYVSLVQWVTATSEAKPLGAWSALRSLRVGPCCSVPLFDERKTMKNFLMRLWKEEEGQDLTEYALLLVLIALSAITVMGTLGSAINNVFSKAASNLNAAS